MRVFIYARVSTNAQDNERQIKELKDLCKAMNYTIVKTYQEVISGAKNGKDNSQIEALVKAVEKDNNVVDGIITWEISRIGRKTHQVLKTIERLNSCGVWIYFKNVNIWTLDPETKKENPMVGLSLAMLSGFATMERETIIERSISGLKVAVQKGNWVGGNQLPYGYRREDKKLEIDEKESEIVKYIYNQYLLGNGTKKIANDLNNKNIETRTKILYGQKGKKWADGTIYNILTNETYIGKKKGKGQIIDIILNSPPIISEETFYKVQQLLKSKNRRTDKMGEYILKDKVKCGICGRNYYPHNRRNGNDKRYMCLSKRYKIECENYGIGIEKLQNAVWTALRHNQSVLDNIYQNAEINNDNEAKSKLLKAELESKKEDLNKILGKKKTLLNLLLSEDIDNETYSYKFKELKNLENQLGLEIEDISSNITELKILSSKSKNINAILKHIKEDKSSFRKMVNRIISDIKILPIKTSNLATLFNKINGQNKFVFIEINTWNNKTNPLCFVIGQRNDEIVFASAGEYDRSNGHYEYKSKAEYMVPVMNLIKLRF